jgi:hypothetical protein
MRVLPRMTSEPPAGYVAFVAEHLEPLLREATEVVGHDHEADELYPEVLTDVAVRWTWLELLRKRLGFRNAADRYLRRSFTRRSEHWRADQSAGVELVEFDVWRPAPRPAWSSAATRLAPFVRPPARTHFGPVCEAAVAWWHAYEARRRRRIIVGVVATLLLIAWLARLTELADSRGWMVVLLLTATPTGRR